MKGRILVVTAIMTLRESGAVSVEALYKPCGLADLPHHTTFLSYQNRKRKFGCCPFSWAAPKSSETSNQLWDVSSVSARVKNMSVAFDMHSTYIETAYKTTMQQTDERTSLRYSPKSLIETEDGPVGSTASAIRHLLLPPLLMH